MDMRDAIRSLRTLPTGEERTADQFLLRVYTELRGLAAALLAGEKPGQTLDATALVHEAYLRLVGSADSSRPGDCPFVDPRHFFLAAAETMRRILVEKARRKNRHKHGGGRQRLELDTIEPADPAAEDEQVLAVDEALQRLAEEEPQVAELVRLRWFGGLSIEQSAAALGISVRTANRHWAYARAWLYRQLKAASED